MHWETNTGCKKANCCWRRSNQFAEACPGANHNPVGVSRQQEPLHQPLSEKDCNSRQPEVMVNGYQTDYNNSDDGGLSNSGDSDDAHSSSSSCNDAKTYRHKFFLSFF